MVYICLHCFWVSSLAYPNLLGTKGYVVVVVVVALNIFIIAVHYYYVH
jgi:hypothetical protein